jgi:hypothetical protein
MPMLEKHLGFTSLHSMKLVKGWMTKKLLKVLPIAVNKITTEKKSKNAQKLL